MNDSNNTVTESPRPLVLYHGGGCADGFCSAFVAWLRLGALADYQPVNYGENPPDVMDREVYILDFCYSSELIAIMAEDAKNLVVIDHHKTAKETIDYLNSFSVSHVQTRFDPDKSGARLSWEFFHPGEPAPWLVNYTEDRDLGRTFNGTSTLEESKEVNACIASWPWTFPMWKMLIHDSTAIAHFADQGQAILRYQNQQVERQCKNAVEIDMAGHKILMVNATLLISEIAGALAVGKPFGASYFIDKTGRAIWSLRSDKNGIDVSEVAKLYGGGGHFHAAGFEEGVKS